MQKHMYWYMAKLVFQIVHPEKKGSSQFDEQLRIIQASDKMEALIKSRMIGIKEEGCYVDEKEYEVAWRFVDVVELDIIPQFTDGMLLHARTDEQECSNLHIDYLKSRSERLQHTIELATTPASIHA